MRGIPPVPSPIGETLSSLSWKILLKSHAVWDDDSLSSASSFINVNNSIP